MYFYMYKNKYLKYKKKYSDLKLSLVNSNKFKNIVNNSYLAGSMVDENKLLSELFEKHQTNKNLYARDSDNQFLTYGYIENNCIDNIIKKLNINENDVFYDLGSGIGNVCFKISYSTKAKSCGYEIVDSRHEVAENINSDFSKIKDMNNKVSLIKDDFTKIKNGLNDATIIFTDSIMFSKELLKKVEDLAYSSPNLRYLVSMKKLDNSDKFEYIETSSCEASWGNSQINIYKKKSIE